MGVQLFANGAAATLSGTLAQGGTTMTLAAGTGAKFPSITGSDYFYVTLFTKDAFAVEQNIEVVKVTARTGDTLTLVRDVEAMTGQSGGFAYDGNATTVYVQMRNTAKTMENLRNEAATAEILSAKKQFGAKLDGVTDDTAALNAAAASGKRIFLDKGTAIISAPINFTVPGTSFEGAGVQSTKIYQNTLTGASAKIFNVTADNCSISGMSLDYNGTPASGATAIYSTGSGCEYHSFKVNRCFNGVFLSTGSSQFAHHFMVYNYVNRGVWLTNIGDAFVDSFICDAITTTNGANGGLSLTEFVEAAHISDGDILNGVYSLVTSAASYASGSRPAYCTFNSLYFDSAASGSLIAQLVASTFTDCWFSGGRSGGGAPGATLGQSDDVTFAGTKFVGCGSHGCQVSAAAIRASFSNSKAQGNSFTTGAGVSAGLLFDANCDQFQVKGGVFGNSFYGGTQGFGIYVAAGCTNYIIDGANVLNNSVTPISDNSTTTSGRVLNCVGYNPRGGSTITVGASPYTYTAGHSPETIYITGGTVSNITVAGVTAFTATEKTINLGPNETVQVTYSAAPTMRKSVH